MTLKDRQREALAELGKALNRLGEALERDPAKDDIVLDGTIQRFEFTYELFWKALQLLLQDEGHIVGSPRAAFVTAYAQHWLDHERIWLDMLEDRNRTTHTYKHEKAVEVHDHVRTRYYPELRKAYEGLIARFGDGSGATD